LDRATASELSNSSSGNTYACHHEDTSVTYALPPATSTRERAYSEMTAVTDDGFGQTHTADCPPGFESYIFEPAWYCGVCPEGVGWTADSACTSCGEYPYYTSDWICSQCQNVNWDWRSQCNRCHTCRDVYSTTASTYAPSLAVSQSTSPRNVDSIVKHRLKKRLSTHPAGVFKDRDWVCVCCGNINWDWRTKCHQCRSEKPIAADNAN
jgi:hypothetical protein